MSGLSYGQKISPSPVYLEGVGYVSSPKIKDIFDIGFEQYYTYLALLQLSPKTYINIEKIQSDNSKEKILSQPSVFSLIVKDSAMRGEYEKVFSFFLDGYEIKFSDILQTFQVLQYGNAVGKIDKNTYCGFCKLALELNNIGEKKEEHPPVFSSERARMLYEKLEESKPKEDTSMKLENVVSALSAKHPSYNLLNIGGLSVTQVYDQFFRLYVQVPYEINAVRWAAYGENEFNYSFWYQSLQS